MREPCAVVSFLFVLLCFIILTISAALYVSQGIAFWSPEAIARRKDFRSHNFGKTNIGDDLRTREEILEDPNTLQVTLWYSFSRETWDVYLACLVVSLFLSFLWDVVYLRLGLYRAIMIALNISIILSAFVGFFCLTSLRASLLVVPSFLLCYLLYNEREKHVSAHREDDSSFQHAAELLAPFTSQPNILTILLLATVLQALVQLACYFLRVYWAGSLFIWVTWLASLWISDVITSVFSAVIAAASASWIRTGDSSALPSVISEAFRRSLFTDIGPLARVSLFRSSGLLVLPGLSLAASFFRQLEPLRRAFSRKVTQAPVLFIGIEGMDYHSAVVASLQRHDSLEADVLGSPIDGSLDTISLVLKGIGFIAAMNGLLMFGVPFKSIAFWLAFSLSSVISDVTTYLIVALRAVAKSSLIVRRE